MNTDNFSRGKLACSRDEHERGRAKPGRPGAHIFKPKNFDAECKCTIRIRLNKIVNMPTFAHSIVSLVCMIFLIIKCNSKDCYRVHHARVRPPREPAGVPGARGGAQEVISALPAF
ncbi:hypothetical protein EVAR_78853_1 [Eumeta japonica]|uniref:Uncharacterized protein n=1 Tax=Eumeta variegata TaxID=151549 RepID=A0A4C1U2V4_EUMVA|nr:hypothetical protein EVAR_78853_1 [Eumeta japonica]